MPAVSLIHVFESLKGLLRPTKPWVRFFATLLRHPFRTACILKQVPSILQGSAWPILWQEQVPPSPSHPKTSSDNPIREYFTKHTTGHGIWKWDHYLDIYHRHLGKFVDREVHITEIGVYSGGSLEMWKSYFGGGCRVYGIDIVDACRAYENCYTRIFIGDQADRGFWRAFRQSVPAVDIVVDDGGHGPEQQRVTLEEILPHIRPGGVYICEDIHGITSSFAAYVYGLADRLNEWDAGWGDQLVSRSNDVQASIASVHLYPFAVVVEMNATRRPVLISRRQGTEWQPFL